MSLAASVEACDKAGRVLDDGTDLIELLPPEYTRPLSVVSFNAVTVPKALGSELLKLLQSSAPLGVEFLHLKRVRGSPSAAGLLEVLVCPDGVELPPQVLDFLRGRDAGEPHQVQVSRYAAVTREQLAAFSVPWPLTYRRPSFEPLELSAAAHERYGRWLRRAEEVAPGGCGCVIVDRGGREVAAAADATHAHPLRHAVMAAIDMVALQRSGGGEGLGPGAKRPRSEEYLCQDCEVVTTHEPCVMCAMALVHSRVRLVAYRAADPVFGGLGGAVSLHTCQPLNHSFRVLRWASA